MAWTWAPGSVESHAGRSELNEAHKLRKQAPSVPGYAAGTDSDLEGLESKAMAIAQP